MLSHHRDDVAPWLHECRHGFRFRLVSCSSYSILCSCSDEDKSRPGEGICGEASLVSGSSLPLHSESSESDYCTTIGVLRQPAEYPVIAVATRHFTIPDDGRVCAIISSSNNADGTSRWCTESPSQIISLKGILPGSWKVRIETVDWCVEDAMH